MRRIDPMSVLFALALLGCAWLVHGCARDALPVPGDMAYPDLAFDCGRAGEHCCPRSVVALPAVVKSAVLL